MIQVKKSLFNDNRTYTLKLGLQYACVLKSMQCFPPQKKKEQNRFFHGEQICISAMPPDRQRSAILTGLMN